MKTNKKIIQLINHGFKPSTLMKLNEGQVNSLYIRLIESKKETKEDAKEIPKNPNEKEYLVSGTGSVPLPPGAKSVSMQPNPGGGYKIEVNAGREKNKKDKILKGGELEEKSLSQQQQKFFGVVRGMQKNEIPKKGKAGKVAKEMSKKDVKDFASTKHKGLPKKVTNKKETNEDYIDWVGSSMTKNMEKAAYNTKMGAKSFGESIKRLVDKHITPKISKKDFINFIIETEKKFLGFGPEIAPTKPETKPRPITEPKPDIDDPDFDPFKDPDPSDDPEARSPLEAPTKPETRPRPVTEPKPDVDDPDYDPFIDPDPSDDPEAKGGDLNLFMKQVKKFGTYKN